MLFTLCGSLGGYVAVMSEGSINLHRGIFALKRQKRFMDSVEEEVERNGKHEPTDDENSQAMVAEHLKMPENAEVAIWARNLCFSYRNGCEVLHHIDLTIPKG